MTVSEQQELFCQHALLPAGYTGRGGTSRCTAAGWTTPVNKCVPGTASDTTLDSTAVTESAAVRLATSSAAASSCPGLPRRPINTVGWPRSCRGSAVGSTCTAECKPGFVGQATTRCQTDGRWRTAVNTCTAAEQVTPPGDAVCADLPEPVPNTKGWPQSCAGSKAGSR